MQPEYTGSGGGIMSFYRTLAPAFDRAGASVRAIQGSAMCATPSRDVHDIDGVVVETLERKRLLHWIDRFPDFASSPTLRRHLAAAWALWEQASEGADFDIVEACDWGLLFVPPAIEGTVPLVVQCHGSIGQLAVHDPVAGEEGESVVARLIERDVMRVAQRVQSPSTANARFWATETGRQVDVLPPAFRLPAVEAAAPSDHGLVVGRLQRWKGPQILAEALMMLGPRAPAVDWVGRDTAWGARNSSTARHLAAAFPLVWSRSLFHLPPEPPQSIACRQASALFNLVPSTWDVFNFTAAEAMASGRPTIVSTGAGASELIEDGANGFTFPTEDAAALAATIDRLMSTAPSRLAEIGRAAQATVRERLDPDRIARERIAAYQRAIDDFKANPPAPVGGWLGDICRPSKGGKVDEMAFLDHHPLRAITRHVAGRIARKVGFR